MKSRSCKNKAIRLQNYVRDKILDSYTELTRLDVRPAIMGETGRDIKLSSEAEKQFSISIECKNQERLNIWEAMEQAEINANNLYPAVVFKRNRSKVYIALELDDFLKLIKK